MASGKESETKGDEVLKSVFDEFDKDGSGKIETKEFEMVLAKIGRDPKDAEELLKAVDPDRTGTLTFDEFADILASGGEGTAGEDLADPKVLEFLRILDQYRLKCESEGDYLEAGRAAQQLEALRKREEKRQNKALRARQLSEKQNIQLAHNMQYSEFNAAWDKYMAEYDMMAQDYIKQMQDRHEQKLKEFQEDLHKELTKRPPKFSRELLDWRARQHLLAKQKKYAEAQKIKRIADELERKEISKMDETRLQAFAQREAKFRSLQQAEMAALLKRIDGRRREHVRQRELDCKRLLQRNRNVQAVLESKQTVEAGKRRAEIRNVLAPPRAAPAERVALDTGAVKKTKGRKKK